MSCEELIDKKVGFIGAGNMAKAIGFRLINDGLLKPSALIVSAPTERNLKIWSEKGVQTTNKNLEVIRNSEIIFIAVKPQFFEEAFSSIKNTEDREIKGYKAFVSIMAGKTIEYIWKIITEFAVIKFEIMRVMPNTPCQVGSGCSVLCYTNRSKYVDNVLQIMMCIGTCDVIPEELFNSVSAVCGSGPAYIYMVIESLADGAVRNGVPRNLAMKLASQTVYGAAKMVIKTEKHPGQLKDEVCSPGGTTIAGVHELEKGALRCTFMNAVNAATSRGVELSKHSHK